MDDSSHPTQAATSVVGDLPAVLDERTKNIEAMLREMKDDLRKTLDDHEARLRAVEQSTQMLGVHMNVWQAAQGAFTTIAMTLSAYLGMRQ